jgi:hypothetical protein
METCRHLIDISNLPQPYYNRFGKKILEFISVTEIVLDLPFIMTRNKRLIINMPYLKTENKLSGDDISAIRLLNFGVCGNIIGLYVQELQSKKTYTLDWNMDYTGGYWLWSLGDISTILNNSNVRNSTH